MGAHPSGVGRGAVLAIAALILLWGLLGIADMKNIPYGGFQGGQRNQVFRVDDGGPADQAGMQVGDRIISIGGISTDDLRALRRQLRAEIGEAREFVVERTDAETGETSTQTVAVTFTGEPASEVAGWWVGIVIGLVFLSCGMLVYLKFSSLRSLLFCIVGLCFAAILFPAPYIEAYGPRMFMESVGLLFLLAGFASLLHFLLVFPERKRILERAGMEKLVYLPAALLILIQVLSLIFEPEGEGLTTVIGYFFGLVFLAYLVLSVVAMIHGFFKATPEERNEFGLDYVLWGVIIGLVPLVFLLVIGIFAPGTPIPGAEYYFFTVVLIPIAFTLGLLKSEREPAIIL